jgi:DNA-directed RNA polymerase subunit M/transcription elongation factor TFIIS
MICPKCGSEKVNIQMVQTGAKSSTKGKGCLFTLGRWLLIICTLGLWLLLGKKKAKTKTKFENQKVAICQNCGNTWNV